MTQDQFITLLIAQFPAVAFVLTALWRGWGYLGPSVRQLVDSYEARIVRMNLQHDKELTEKDRQIEFHDQLRQECLEDKKLLEERTTKAREAVEELTHVVQESIELTAILASTGKSSTKSRVIGDMARTRSRTRKRSEDN